MRNRFAEYYDLSDERINEIWDDSLIVFDTNVLLNLYRYNNDARDEFIKALKFYKERLWIPYQVGLEFHRRREEIMRKNAAAYKSLSGKLSEQLIKVVSSLEGEYARHPYINMKDIKKKVERCTESIGKTLEKQEKEHPDYSQGDETLYSITELFDGRVGEDFTEKDLEALYKEGEKRYANQVPPGYCDEKNKKEKGKRSLYGDLIVWKQTIHHCKKQDKSVIFITDDHKSDWWEKVEGKHSPRKELIKEFTDSTGQGILIYDSGRFLEYAKRNKELKVSKKTINEVEKVKSIDSPWLADYESGIIQMPMTSLVDIPNVYNYDEFLESLKKKYNPISLSEFPSWRYNLDVFRKMIESLGGFGEAQRRIQEVQTLLSASERRKRIAKPINKEGDLKNYKDTE